MEKKVKVKNPNPHLVSVDGILYQPGEVKTIVLNEKVEYALKKGILVEVKPQQQSKPQPKQNQATSSTKQPAKK